MMVLGRREHNLKLIKKLVFVLILFAFGFMLNTNTAKADTVKEAYLKKGTEVQNKLRNLITDYLSGPIFRKATLEECIETLKKETRHYAKRQMTWFNNKLNTVKLDGSKPKKVLVEEIIEYLNK